MDVTIYHAANRFVGITVLFCELPQALLLGPRRDFGSLSPRKTVAAWGPHTSTDASGIRRGKWLGRVAEHAGRFGVSDVSDSRNESPSGPPPACFSACNA
jgi:hypothetical protein